MSFDLHHYVMRLGSSGSLTSISLRSIYTPVSFWWASLYFGGRHNYFQFSCFWCIVGLLSIPILNITGFIYKLIQGVFKYVVSSLRCFCKLLYHYYWVFYRQFELSIYFEFKWSKIHFKTFKSSSKYLSMPRVCLGTKNDSRVLVMSRM